MTTAREHGGPLPAELYCTADSDQVGHRARQFVASAGWGRVPLCAYACVCSLSGRIWLSPRADVCNRRVYQEVVALPDYDKLVFHDAGPRPWAEVLGGIPPAALDFISRLLVLRPADRPSAVRVRGRAHALA